MRFKRRTALALLSAAFLSFSVSTTAEEPNGHLLSNFEMHVKAGHDDEFRAGIAEWKECYLEHGGTRAWNTWQRQHGQGMVYVVAFVLDRWADLDTPEEASRKCQGVVMEKIMPPVYPEKGTSSYARLLPEVSRNTPVTDLVWISSFRTNDPRLMRRTIEQVVSAVIEAEGEPRGYWYRVQGGDAASADYFLMIPFENYAAMDESRTGVYEIVTNLRGEVESERLRADMHAAIDSRWSYLFRRVPDLSRNP